MLFIKTLIGETITIDYWDENDTIEDIKYRIADRCSHKAECMRLIFAGKGLEDGRMAKDYNIQHGSTLHLVLRLRGA